MKSTISNTISYWCSRGVVIASPCFAQVVIGDAGMNRSWTGPARARRLTRV